MSGPVELSREEAVTLERHRWDASQPWSKWGPVSSVLGSGWEKEQAEFVPRALASGDPSPSLPAEDVLRDLHQALGFFASALKSGEKFGSDAARMLARAQDALDRLARCWVCFGKGYVRCPEGCCCRPCPNPHCPHREGDPE